MARNLLVARKAKTKRTRKTRKERKEKAKTREMRYVVCYLNQNLRIVTLIKIWHFEKIHKQMI